MSEHPSKLTRSENVSRVDELLSLLGNLSKRDPSPALRDQLSALAARCLKENNANAWRPGGRGRRTLVWLRPALAAALLIAAGLIVARVVHFNERIPVPAHKTAKVNRRDAPPEHKADVAATAAPIIPRCAKTHHLHSVAISAIGARQMTMGLPYSNSAIENGTATTIRVSMSQSELLSLGFPISSTVQDRRIVAQLTLGDDGLPRAITLPLPLEVVKEKK